MGKKLLIIANAVTTSSGARGVQANKVINYLAGENQVFLITDQSTGKNYDSELRIHKLFFAGSIPVLIKSILRRVLGPVMTFDPIYIRASAKIAGKIIRDENIETVLTLSMDLSNAVTGIMVKKRFPETELFTYLSDPVSDNRYLCRNRLSRYFYRRFEARLCRASDSVISPSFQTTETLKSRHGDRGNGFIRIPHCYDGEPIPVTPETNGFILHMGSLNERRTPFPVLDELVRSEAGLRACGIKGIQLIGTVSKKLKPRLKERYKKYGWIKIVDKVPYEQVGEYIRKAEILMVIDAPMVSSQFFPSKIVEYLPYHKPIIGVTPEGSETERILMEIGETVITYPDIDKIVNSIEGAMQRKTGAGGHSAREYHISKVGRMWAEALHNTLRSGPGSGGE